MYCPELNSDDLIKEDGKGLLDLITECNKFTADISQLDPFLTKISLAMKTKGIQNKKGLLTIIYSRRWCLCAFCVNAIAEVLELGKESENSNSTEDSS
jgi:hypothetical protein